MNFKRFHESKNLFDINSVGNPPFVNASGTPESNIGTLVDGVFTAKIGLYSRATYINYSTTLAQGTYTISFDAKETIVNSLVLRVRVGGVNIIGETINNIPSTYTHISRTFTLKSESQIQIGIMPTGNAQQSTNLDLQFKDIMINEGSTALPYEPYSSEVWHDTPHYIHNTSTDTITTLPAVLYPNDTTATVGLKGNMSQSGTPTPTDSIQPNECGERTGNLFNKDKQAGNIYVTDSIQRYGVEIPAEAGTYAIVGGTNTLFTKEKYGTTYGTAIDTSVQRIITLPQNGYILIYAGRAEDYTVSNIMLNRGSTALPYEPYGYKIPISSNSTTTPVYLGEVQTTRKIKKLVLDGTENWSTYQNTYYITVSGYYHLHDVGHHLSVCSHFPIKQEVTLPEMCYGLGGLIDEKEYIAWNGNIVFNPSPMILSLTDWKSYLAQQYAAGTPVTVWYVLATPETGIVNEPLRKIGDYADEVSGITIPTIAGANTISVDTTLQPSEVTVNYKGWHPVSAVHERENGVWT